ncbi:bifunctional enoyl-CoA hydratase/phosphate acetyltransferase [Uliginosibacterium sp. sgz301328]|uniref:bifunctional enoyl-CoA hydratase/phosphate acetyltransferase n=1 Tax=Uliginosibacterium sp. sgz301328 TaxID=3243764 RepID=UPI00359E13C2
MNEPAASTPMPVLENVIFDDIKIGDGASYSRTVTREDIQLFAAVSGDLNPTHIDEAYVREAPAGEVVAHSMLSASFVSAALGNQFPGPGTVYVGQELHFRAPVVVGDALTVHLTCRAKDTATGQVTIDCNVTNQRNQQVLTGTATVHAPTVRVRREAWQLPELTLTDEQARYRKILAMADGLPAIRMGVVHPCDAESLLGALHARDEGLIEPFLVGPVARIRRVAEQLGVDLHGCTLVDTEHSVESAERAVQMARAGEVDGLMKGSLHTDEYMGAIVATQTGLRTSRRISHVYVADVPRYPRPLLITDAAINIQPDLPTKVSIAQNAIDVAHALGIERPRVAILAAVETINPKMPSTLDAAALCKMADRGQITGAILDGPLAFDNAVSEFATKAKGIVSEVAGRADILMVPNLEAGNMLGKQLEYLAGGFLTGVVVGARVPIVLTSRADRAEARSASCAIVKRIVAYRKS